MANDYGKSGWISDNGDGTYTNPILWGDYPDNDIIRVGDTYYMSSTSMHLFPGCPIMSSRDLVNWKYEGYAVERMEGDSYNLVNGDVYDEGPWATSLRYHNGKFYLLFNINFDSAYVCVTENVKDPWRMFKLEDELYDPGLFFDDDGRIYVVHGQGELYLSELRFVDEASGQLSIISKKEPGEKRNGKKIFRYNGADPSPNSGFNEGSHVYKINGYYYILSTPVWKAGSKKEIAIRTRDLHNGPYEWRDVLTSFMNFGQNGIHQGGIVDIPQADGTEYQWWAVIFQDRGKLGRVPMLQPVYWENGWPYMGEKGWNGEKAVITAKKPFICCESIQNQDTFFPASSDDFCSEKLGLQWQWNHNPVPDCWSLMERPGFLRLKTATVTQDLSRARNTLTQRVTGPDCTATVKIDVSGMREGDMAGLSVMQRESGFIGVHKCRDGYILCVYDCMELQISIPLPENIKDVWLRAQIPKYEYREEFFYSLDGRVYRQLGGRYDMHYGTYVGMRFGIFNYAQKSLGGYIDVDYFEVETRDGNANRHQLDRVIDAGRYDDCCFFPDQDWKYGRNIKTGWENDYVNPEYNFKVKNLKSGDWIAYQIVDFLSGNARWGVVDLSAIAGDGIIEFRENSRQGAVIAEFPFSATDAFQKDTRIFMPMKVRLKGKHQIILSIKGGEGEICQINWFAFVSEKPDFPPVPQNVRKYCVFPGTATIIWDNLEKNVKYDLSYNGTIISDIKSGFTITGLPDLGLPDIFIRAGNLRGYSQWVKV